MALQADIPNFKYDYAYLLVRLKCVKAEKTNLPVAMQGKIVSVGVASQPGRVYIGEMKNDVIFTYEYRALSFCDMLEYIIVRQTGDISFFENFPELRKAYFLLRDSTLVNESREEFVDFCDPKISIYSQDPMNKIILDIQKGDRILKMIHKIRSIEEENPLLIAFPEYNEL